MIEDNKGAAETAFIEQVVERIKFKREDKKASTAPADMKAAMSGYWKDCA